MNLKGIFSFVVGGMVMGSALLTGAVDGASSGSALFQAIRNGESGAVRKLLKNGADIHAHNEAGDVPLMAAAMNSDLRMVEILLQAGAEVNETNKAGATALMRAATFADKARLLVEKGARVEVRSSLGNTALILAARKFGNSATVKLLLDHGASANSANVLGATPLMAAVAAEDLDSARLLLDHGADVNAKPNMDGGGFIWGGGRTPLMWAAFLGNEELVKFLLQRGAKVNDLYLAGTALTQAGWGGHVGVARLLLDAGAQVDQRDLIANYTPLHWAASSERSSPALVELLLSHGADANAEGGQPVDNFLGVAQTPLSLARKRGDTPIVRALLKAGAHDSVTASAAAGTKATSLKLTQAGAKNVDEAIQRALPRLATTTEESVSTFLKHASKQDCVSCHQQQLPLAAISKARTRHYGVNSEATSHQLALLKRSITMKEPDSHGVVAELEQATFHPEPTISEGYVSLVLHTEQEPGFAGMDALVHQLSVMQHADGHWSWNLPRPPMQASDITATASAVHVLRNFGIPARRQELNSSIQRAKAWLGKAGAETNEERVHQLLGLAWAGEKATALKKLSDELIRLQRADGGWGQLAGLGSDAYATGQALYALVEGGKVPSEHPAVERGVGFLLRTQFADGTWLVRTRAHPFQPPMESGFSHGKDGWISAAGTSWAVMGLAATLDAKHAPGGAALLSGVSRARIESVPAQDKPQVDVPVEFVRDIQPLLERSCVACHSGDRPKGGFKMGNRESLLKGGNRGEPVIVPGQPESGQFMHVVQDQVEDLEMPPLEKRAKFPALTKDEINRLNAWIAQGANWPEGTSLRVP